MEILSPPKLGVGKYARNHIPIAARFWARVDKRDPDECWNWIACRLPMGYGRLSVKLDVGVSVTMYAHRISYELHYGPIPAGMCVCHKCDNPPCVNPAHLFLGTQADNMRDRDAKLRQRRTSAV